MVFPTEIASTDVASYPPPRDWDKEKYNLGASLIERSFILPPGHVNLDDDAVKYFADVFFESMLQKLLAGIKVPAYAQLRDFALMFKNNQEALIHSPYFKEHMVGSRPEDRPEEGVFNPKFTRIAEVELLRGGIVSSGERLDIGRRLYEEIGQRPIHTRNAITCHITSGVSPYFLAGVVIGSLVNTKYVKTKLVTLDTPSFGFPLVSEKVLREYDMILYGAKCKNINTNIHPHSSSYHKLKDLKNLGIIEFHSSDLGLLDSYSEELKNEGKGVCAGIARTDESHAESLRLLYERLKNVATKHYDLVKYAQPDCGLFSLDRKIAFTISKRVAKTVDNFNKRNN